jgi:hypothetical protein
VFHRSCFFRFSISAAAGLEIASRDHADAMIYVGRKSFVCLLERSQACTLLDIYMKNRLRKTGIFLQDIRRERTPTIKRSIYMALVSNAAFNTAG